MSELKRYKIDGRWSRGGGPWESFMTEDVVGEYYKVVDVKEANQLCETEKCDNEAVYKLCDNCLCDIIFESRESQEMGTHNE